MRTAIAFRFEELWGIIVRLPLVHGNLTHIRGSASQPRWRRKAVHQHIVPLVKNRDSPIAIRQAREGERAVGGAFGKCKILAVRISKAHVALGKSKAVVRSTAVEPLVRRAAH